VAVPVLWHIEVSHYNEKARWALDWKEVPHRRRAPLPGVLHPVVAFAKTRAVTLPVLEIDGEAIGDSTRIIEALERRFPQPPLYPADPAQRRRALELEEFFDEEVAPYVRRWLFYEISQERERAVDGLRAMGARVPRRLAGPTVRVVARRYGGSAATREEARERTRAGFERLVSEVQPSGYLVGEDFSVADLTAASVLFPLAEPPQFQYRLPATWPSTVQRFREGLPGEALEWVRDMWRRHRPPSAEVQSAKP
jgi:glutathione S-transferase